MRLLVQGGLPIAGGIIGAGVDEMRWPRPVRPGDTLRLESEVLEVRPSKSRPDQGMIKVRITTFNQRDEPVQIMVGELRRAATPGLSSIRFVSGRHHPADSSETTRRSAAYRLRTRREPRN